MTLSIAQLIGLVNKLEKVWKDLDVAYFEVYYPVNCLGLKYLSG
jgi:hypothetical protein